VVTWDLVICDEITKLKNYKTQRTKATKKLNRQYGLGLSGIPLENRLEELHSVMDWVMPGMLGPGWLFVREHVVKDASGNVRGYRDIDAVRRRIAPYYIRRRKKDVLKQLPDKVITDLTVELSSDEWVWYDATRDQIREQIKHNDKLSVVNILTLMLRLKQITGDVRLVGETADTYTKTSMVGDILDGAGEHKVVFFSQFAQLVKMLADDWEVPYISGSVSSVKRRDIIADFQAGGYPCLFSTDAGAYGITLTRADVIVHIDQPWNPAVLRQREDRLHRIGQKSSVQVVHLIAARTIDLHVRRILHRKMALIEAVLDDEMGDDMVPITKHELLGMLDDN
jgi:SNF2 family DNA or RNA helicase